jgi:glycosyltransferase involved in cell wall biosynthesis
MMKKVQILMAVYNGQMFIREQLDSLISQTHPNMSILIRDDESSDSTVSIIEEYQKKYENIKLIRGKNIGVANSFLELIKEADEADYYAFCDQDDYWYPDKISNAVEAISSKEIPDSKSIFYCCGYEIVDENLIPTGKNSAILSDTDHSFANALFDTLSIGCSIVINSILFEELRNNIPSYCFMHDHWIYLVAEISDSIFIFDDRVYIKYRKHSANVTVKGSFLRRLGAAFNRAINSKTKYRTSRQAIALKELYYDKLSIENKKLLDNVINANLSTRNALKLLFNKSIRKRDKLGQFGLNIRILLRIL